ncbi:diguanylate cyclase [Aquabacterium humicola]|uniref:diguanylate cyclase n=1 Tax=Aquabacterium humicola TaxID=3237377 RepID=UPI002542A0C7|nr:diguanylate cyclase [Rubrivivax pictus]
MGVGCVRWGLAVLAWLAAVLPCWAQGVVVGPQGVTGPPAAGTTATAAALTGPLGAHASLFDETPGRPLDLAGARAQLAAGAFRPSAAEVPNLGNAAPPRWMHLVVHNPGDVPLAYRLYAAEGWVDRIDVWLVAGDAAQDRAQQHWSAGDERSPGRYLRIGMGFGFDTLLPPGRSEVFVRADSVDAAAMTLRLIPLHATAAIEGDVQHWMGLVHGFLLALVATYGLLWLALRDRNHLRYVGYVGAYLYMHLAYSGIGPQLAWPDAPGIGRYAILLGMVLFSSAGLTFARSFLALQEHAPRLDRIVCWTVRGALATMALFIAVNVQLAAVHLAFAYITLFTLSMVGLGLVAQRRGREQAGIFVVATLASMLGTLVTTLAVMGVLPFNIVTFHAVEAGVMLEATIWALALGLRLRRQREDGARARELAEHDPLTGLHNRRGFLEQALPVYLTASRNARPLSAIVLDIDHFKRINDRHGHAGGDRTLTDVAERIRAACRGGDIVARWGGEEFVMLLPETGAEQARMLAERLRETFAKTPLVLADGQAVAFTASFGVAVRADGMSLDQLLQAADMALYRAKDAGRDRVAMAGDGSREGEPAEQSRQAG